MFVLQYLESEILVDNVGALNGSSVKIFERNKIKLWVILIFRNSYVS